MLNKVSLLMATIYVTVFFCSPALARIRIESDVHQEIGDHGFSQSIPRKKTQISTVSRVSNAPALAPNSNSRSEHQRLSEIINLQLDDLQQLVDQEASMMTNVVRLMDRVNAQNWLSSFISAKPLNCPVKKQRDWVEAIITGVENNQLPLCQEILGLVACIISIESGFHVDPLAIDPSRGEDMSTILDRAERDMVAKLGPLMSVPPVPHYYKIYKDKYYPMILECKTEGDVEVVAAKVVEDLKKDVAFLPDFLKSILDKELNKVKNVVRTKGSMQLNFPRAIQVMRERGENFTEEELRDYMYTLNGGIDVGIAAIKPMFVQYAAMYGAPGNRSWLFFVGMDYHYGPFSSRNMMEQIRIKDLSGRDIAIDGDFLNYDDSGWPSDRESETIKAADTFLPKTGRAILFKNFLLEKYPHYIYTDTHKRILAAHQARFGPTPFAIIGDLWMGESAQIKHGATWKTQSYLKKLDRYLNSIPWDLFN